MSLKRFDKVNELRTGSAVPTSGIYRVDHPQHRLPLEVTLIEGHLFARCSRCNEAVYYTLERSAPSGVSPNRFALNLYELPDLSEPGSQEEDDSLAG